MERKTKSLIQIAILHFLEVTLLLSMARRWEEKKHERSEALS